MLCSVGIFCVSYHILICAVAVSYGFDHVTCVMSWVVFCRVCNDSSGSCRIVGAHRVVRVMSLGCPSYLSIDVDL